MFAHELINVLDIDSVLSIGSVKGQEKWMERQLTTCNPPPLGRIEEYLGTCRPEVVLFMETPFSANLLSYAHKYNARTAGIVMHENFQPIWHRVDKVICPCNVAYEKALARGLDGIPLFLPISQQMFPFTERTGNTFLVNAGYGGVNDRRQLHAIVKAFEALNDPEARLIINSQSTLPERLSWTHRGIEVRKRELKNPADTYRDGDIYLGISAYGGYERPILEAMLSGLPTVVMNAEPMSLFQHDKDFHLASESEYIFSSEWVNDTVYSSVNVEDLTEKMRWLLTIDTPKYSRWARAQAEAQTWEGNPEYKRLWLECLSA